MSRLPQHLSDNGVQRTMLSRNSQEGRLRSPSRECDQRPNSIKDILTRNSKVVSPDNFPIPSSNGLGDSSNHPRSHNLDIRQYGLDEIYALFGYQRSTISINDLKKAKQRVLMTHPDKSGMPADYFIFYKKALEVLATDYAEQNRAESSNQRMAELEQNGYEYTHGGGEEEERMRRVAGKAAAGERFQRDFNKVFEEQMQQKIDESRNDWFKDDLSIYDTTNVSKSNMAQSMEAVKQQQRALARYTGGVREMTHHIGTRLYDQADDGDEGEEYISGDPFAKLKFEDLRKVHKDETVFRVSESDYNNVQTYKNTEEYGRARSSQQFEQLTKDQGERILLQRERERAAKIQEYQRQAYEQGLENERKQEAAKAMFLRLAN